MKAEALCMRTDLQQGGKRTRRGDGGGLLTRLVVSEFELNIRILGSGFGHRGSGLGCRGSGLGYRGSGLG